MNTNLRRLTFLAILLAPLAFIPYAAHQYPNDPLTAAVSSGLFCLISGWALGYLTPYFKTDGLLIRIPQNALKSLENIKRYMEHTDVVATIKRALAYYSLLLEIVTKNEGEIFVHYEDGHQEKIDPVSAEIPPEEED